MGLLSKKLGHQHGPAGVTDGSTVVYKWSNQGYTMQQLMTKFKLPCVVQCVTEACTIVWSDFHFDLRQPMLLRSRRTVRKVHARSIDRKSIGGVALEEFGPPLAIPEDYDGWFAAAPKGENKVRRHFRVEGVARPGVRRFLVSTKLPVFTACSGADGEQDYKPHEVQPGEVLTRVCVLEEEEGVSSPAIVRDQGPCLECLDEKEEPVLLPLTTRGILYEVADQYPADPGTVFQISSVISGGNSCLPRLLTLVHGEPPVLAFTFTGMLRAYSVFTEETLLAGTLNLPESSCLEMATDSATKFKLALNENAIKQTLEYGNAYQACEHFGPRFVTGIKVSFSLNPEPLNLEDLDLAMYQNNTSDDAQEVDANNEFEFAWNSKMSKLGAEQNGGKSKPVPFTSFQSTSRSQTDTDGEMDDIPQHRDFTESEIRDLMRLKGLNADTPETSDFDDLESLKDNNVRDNPLYYMAKNKKVSSTTDISCADHHPPEDGLCSLEDQEDPIYPSSTMNSDLNIAEPTPLTSFSSEEANNTQPCQTFTSMETAIQEGRRLKSAHVMEVNVDVHTTNSQSTALWVENTYRQAQEYDSDQEDHDSELFETDEADLLPDLSSFSDVPCTPAKEFTDDQGEDSGDSDIENAQFSHDKLTEKIPHFDFMHENLPKPTVDGNVDTAKLPLENNREVVEVSLPTPVLCSQLDSLTNRAETDSFFIDKNSIIRSGSQSETPESSNGTKEAAQRVTHLIDEVTTLVDVSTDRIAIATPKQQHSPSAPIPISPPSLSSPQIDSGSPIDTGSDPVTDSPPNPADRNDDLIDAAVSSISHGAIDITQEPGDPTPPKKKLSPWTKKKKIQNAFNFITGLGDSKSKSKSDEFSSNLKRSNKHKNLWDSSNEKMDSKPPGPGWLSKVSSEGRLNKILRPEKAKSNRFNSPKVTLHPHIHPHKHSHKCTENDAPSPILKRDNVHYDSSSKLLPSSKTPDTSPEDCAACQDKNIISPTSTLSRCSDNSSRAPSSVEHSGSSYSPFSTLSAKGDMDIRPVEIDDGDFGVARNELTDTDGGASRDRVVSVDSLCDDTESVVANDKRTLVEAFNFDEYYGAEDYV